MQRSIASLNRRGLVLIGSYPPPLGGCSVHVERLHHALAREYDVEVVDLYGDGDNNCESWLVRCGRTRPLNAFRALRALRRIHGSIVHFHVAGMDAFLAAGFPMLAVLPRGVRRVLTIHSGSFVARFDGSIESLRLAKRNEPFSEISVLLLKSCPSYRRFCRPSLPSRRGFVRSSIQFERMLGS